MEQFIETAHFTAMLRERDIKHSWVESAVRQPDSVKDHPDGTCLRVVVNATSVPGKYVTAFFDRLRRHQCGLE